MSDAAPVPSPAPTPATPAPPSPRTAVGNRIDFSASLDTFQGPLDLLLYLIKENEVEITEIPIAMILEQYLKFLDQAPQWDLQLAGEFLVMAASLMEIKSRELLPVTEQPGDAEEIIEDPRSELVRQLLQYRSLKDQAKALETMQDAWMMHRPRGFFGDIPDETPAADEASDRATAKEALFELDLFALFTAYERTLKAVLAQTPRHISYSGESIEEKITRIETLLKTRPFARFVELVTDPLDRADIAATFVALLELTRRRAVRLSQQHEFGVIDVNVAGEGEAETASREQAAAAEAAEQEALKQKAEQDARMLAEGGGKPAFVRRQAKPRFEGVIRPEDLEEIDTEEHEIGRRIDAILAAADAISERFEQSREGRVRDDNQPPLPEMPALPPTPSESPAPSQSPAPPAPPTPEEGAPAEEASAEKSETPAASAVPPAEAVPEPTEEQPVVPEREADAPVSADAPDSHASSHSPDSHESPEPPTGPTADAPAGNE